jgi:transcriptional regulator with XRE-family HTH domain
MLTVRDLLAAARAAQSLPSNYALAKLLDVRENDVSRWQNGRNIPSPAMVVRLAELAKLDPADVLPAIEAERAGDDVVRAAWARAAKRLQVAGLAAVAAILSLWIGGGPDGGATLALAALALPLPAGAPFYTSSP